MLVVVGPTASGKSATAILVAERIGGEIVSCDAVQVYRGFDAGTAKPTRADRARVPHHLIDVADPRRDYCLADYIRDAGAAIDEIFRRGRVPVLVGGTGMYLRGLLRGIVPAPARDPALRDRLREMAGRRGPARMHRWLAGLDRGSAERLHPSDTQRIVRALEIVLVDAIPWSERLARDGTWSSGEERYRAVKVGLDMDRGTLALRIDRRVDSFFAAGLVAEVRALIEAGVPPVANAFRAIGYREVLRALRAGSDPADLREAVAASTRRYAKRQRTWFRKEPGIHWLDAGEGPPALAARIETLWRA